MTDVVLVAVEPANEADDDREPHDPLHLHGDHEPEQQLPVGVDQGEGDEQAEDPRARPDERGRWTAAGI